MSTDCGKRKLRGLYQVLLQPTTRATDASESMSETRKRDTTALFLEGTNGDAIVYPFWGRFKRFAQSCQVFANQNAAVLLWLAALSVLATVTTAALFETGKPLPAWWQLVALAGVGGVAERQSIRMTSRVEMSVSFLPFVFAAVAYGPLAAFIVAGGASLCDARPPLLKWAVYTPARALTGAASGLAAAAIASPGTGSFGRVALATTAAGLALFTADTIFNVGTLLVRRAGSAIALVGLFLPLAALALPLYIPIVALIAYGYARYSFWVAATFLVPALAFQRVIQMYQEQRDSARALEEANGHLETANLSFASALVATLDARDRYTAGHSAAVAAYARDIARRLGMSTEDQQRAHLCGLVHDIGKVGLPPGLLEKPGPLTLEERRQMEEHAPIGERILANVETYAEIAYIVRHHHERVDGNGYPDGLSGEDIPMISRILAVADAYDAMTSDRPYRDAMPSEVARIRLAQAVESQFDISVVAAFEAILASANEQYKRGASFDRGRSSTVADLKVRAAAAM
jgi:putative nucleotidyltransferase with HDIG domain